MPYEARHPSTRILEATSSSLAGKTIVMGITGSVAAFLSPKLARELIRHGANVVPVISKAGLRMVGKDLLWWATGNEPITKITGDLEHIRLAGVMNQPADLMMITPCTTNTVAKLSAGIADTPVTLIASSLMGKGVPLMINPVAHEDLINSPPVKEGISKLKSWGVRIIEPIREEGKAKVPEIQDIVEQVIDVLTEKSLYGKKIIITAGASREYIDNVRFITNSASGKTGIKIATLAYQRGADVHLVIGPTNEKVPDFINKIDVINSEEMTSTVLTLLRKNDYSVVILSAAMADFTPEKTTKGKIKSGQSLNIDLKQTVKLSDKIKEIAPTVDLVLFKAEWNISKEKLIESARGKMEKCNADLIIANDLSEPGAGFQTDTNHVFLINKEKELEITSLKSLISITILDTIENNYML